MAWWNRFTSTAREKLKEETGSVLVDAALSLPVFCVALALLLGLLRQVLWEESMAAGAREAAQTLTRAEAALQLAGAGEDEPPDEAASMMLYSGEWLLFDRELKRSAAGCALDPKPRTILFLTEQKAELRSGRTADGLIRAKTSTESPPRLPLLRVLVPAPERNVLFRPWQGESHQADENSERVYVFPHYGERFHLAGCRILKQGSVEEILTAALKRKYRPCKICHPEKLSFGSIVFLFSDGSSVYHRKECASITKYYVSMPRSEAESEGYTPCSYCCKGS